MLTLDVGKEKLTSVCESCQKVAPLLGAEGAAAGVERETGALRAAWQALAGDVGACVEALEGRAGAWAGRDRLAGGLLAWVGAAERDVAAGCLPRVDPTEKRAQLDRFKVSVASTTIMAETVNLTGASYLVEGGA